MPSVSKKQHNLMAMVAHDPAAAKRLGIPQSVGKEFTKADVGRKFARGGEMKESKAMAKKEISFMEKKGAPKSMIKHEKAEYGMKKGGIATSLKAHAAAPASKAHAGLKAGGSVKASPMGKVVAGGKRPHGEHTVQQKGHTRAMMPKMAGGKGMKKGGRTC